MKIARIIDEMYKKNIDSVIVLKPENIAYLSEFRPSDFSVLILKDEPVLFVPKMDLMEACKSSKIQVEKFVSFDKIKENLEGTVGIENSMPFGIYKKIHNGLEIKTTDIIEVARSIKSKNEIKNIKKAVKIAEVSIKDLKLDGREYEVAAAIEYNMRMNGSQKTAFETVVASGVRSSLPHARASLEILKSPVLMDWGAVYNNYCSDITRTVIETEKQEEIFDIVLQTQKNAIDAIKPGIKASYVDKVARDVIEEYGYEEAFIHSVGHGIGLEVHESPSLSSKEKGRLKEGMVVTVEPGIYLEGEFGVRIEDIVCIKKRAKLLTKLPRRLKI